MPQLRVLQLLIQLRDRDTERITEDRAGDGRLGVLAPDSLELETRIALDDLLHLGDVCLVESRGLAVSANAHVLEETRVVEGEGGEDLEGGGGHAALVGGGVFEEDAAGGFEAELGVLGDEEVGALDDVGDEGLAVLDQLVAAHQVDGLGAAAAGDEDVGQAGVAQVEGVAEGHAVGDHLAGGEGDVGLVEEDAVAVLGELGDVELGDHDALLGEAEELGVVDSVGVHEDTGAVDDGGVLLVAEENLVGAEISVRATSLHLADGGWVKV